MSVKVDTTKLDDILRKVPGNRSKVVRSAAFHILDNARARTPVDSGRLKDNSAVVVSDNGESANVEYYQEYAHYVELGTWKMYARPFLYTAVETERQNFIEQLKKVIQ